MRRKIFLFSALLAGVSVIVTAVLIIIAAHNDFFDSVRREVIAEASYLRSGVELAGEDYLDRLEAQSGHRLTIIAADGTVRYDSVSDPAQMDNHLDRPEVQAALTAGRGESTRYSATLREQTYYYAVRLTDGSVLRLASTTDSVFASFNRLLWLVILIALAVFLLSAAVASRITRRIVRPINTIDLDHPENNTVYDEIVPLLTRIKEQRNQINNQMSKLDRQRVEFAAITENMDEGFLVLDRGGKVLSHNKSALQLLDIHAANSVGLNILALNRSAVFREVIQSALSGSIRESVMELAGRSCQIFASPVLNGGAVQGIVLILMDVTEKQEREKLRREFTANVSHELKTPLTAISGYAEIMMHGVAKQEDIPEFSASIYQEAQRLIALVRDLMFLSRLDEDIPLPRQRINLLALSQTVAARLEAKAAEYGVTVEVAGDAAEINGIPAVLEEMLFNLLDNAIKYNRRGGRASISVKDAAQAATVEIADTGVGIPKAEQERIFERFYRVDKSHNQAVEGTGLGLAIVKHGAMLHAAKVGLVSNEHGSIFRVTFPRLDQTAAR